MSEKFFDLKFIGADDEVVTLEIERPPGAWHETKETRRYFVPQGEHPGVVMLTMWGAQKAPLPPPKKKK
jgi:hypothetical protein